MYRCHICGSPLDFPGTCPDCGERPVYNWMNDTELKKEVDVTKKDKKDDESEE